MRCLRRILGIKWQDKVTNSSVLSRAKTPTIYTLLSQRRLRWLGHVHRMEDGRIPKDLLYGELVCGKRTVGRPHLRYKDVCKRDMKACNIDHNTWESHAGDRVSWKGLTSKGLLRRENTALANMEAKRTHRKANLLN